MNTNKAIRTTLACLFGTGLMGSGAWAEGPAPDPVPAEAAPLYKAGDPLPADPASTTAQMDRMEEGIRLMKKRIEFLAIQSQLEQSEALSDPALRASRMNQDGDEAQQKITLNLPRVYSIFGTDPKRLSARIQLPGGGMQTIRAGDQLATNGGQGRALKVLGISRQGVLVEIDRRAPEKTICLNR